MEDINRLSRVSGQEVVHTEKRACVDVGLVVGLATIALILLHLKYPPPTDPQ